MQKRFGVLLPALCFLFSLAASAQMLDPAIDRDDEPFSYFSQPTDVIGVMDARAGTLVSPEGYFYTGFGELMFFTGDPPVPLHQRVKTLYDGYLSAAAGPRREPERPPPDRCGLVRRRLRRVRFNRRCRPRRCR